MGGRSRSLKRRHPCTMPSSRIIASSLLLLSSSNHHTINARIPQPVIPSSKRKLDYASNNNNNNNKILHEPFFVPSSHVSSESRQLLQDPTLNETWNVTTLFDYTTASNSSEIFSTSSNGTNRERLRFQPIRIRAILAENEFLDQNLTEKLFEEILSPAILAWSAALRVEPVESNLTVDRSQLVDGKSCGLGVDTGHPSVIIPESHFTEGLADTDFVVYLSLGQLETNITESPSAAPTNMFGVSPKDFQSLGEWASQEITNETQKINPCTGDFVAGSVYCSTDQWDRPTAALLHLCLVDDFFTNIRKSMTTVMHELAHSLGFNPQSMAHFRRRDGTPYTERDEDGNVPLQQVECTGIPNATQHATLQLPSPDVLRFRNVRGGVRVAEIVTPNVQQTVRNHFDCFSLAGAELESSDSDGCLGDHWERRLFRTDLMNAIIDEVPFSLRISPITLALFADSGWYQVDLSRASLAAGWGRGAGCDFVERECVSNSQVTSFNQDFFCNDVVTRRGTIEEIQGCSPDMFRKAVCGIAQYETALPPEFQYFGDPDVGGNEPLIDFCPVYTGFSNGDCTDETTQVFFKISSGEEFGQKNSRCLVGRLKGNRRTSLCLPIACVVEDQSLRIKVGGTWRTCDYKGQEYPMNGHGIQVVCPDPVRTCPTFYCPLDCLGTNGYCNYETGTCDCVTSTSHLNFTNFTLSNFTLTNTTITPFDSTECNEISINQSTIFFVNETDTQAVTYLAEDSPLSDYYVPSKSDLKDDGSGTETVFSLLIITVWAVVSLVAFSFLVFGGDWYARRFKRGRSSHDDSSSILPHPPTQRNKDKFVATLLVDLRIRHPLESVHEITQEYSLPDTAGETDLSLSFEEQSEVALSDSATSHESQPLQPLYPERTSRDEDEEEVPAFVIRRRFVSGGCNNLRRSAFGKAELL